MVAHLSFFLLSPLLAFAIEILLVGWKNSSAFELVSLSKSSIIDLVSWALVSFRLLDFICFFLSFGLVNFLALKIKLLPHLELFAILDNKLLAYGFLFLFKDFIDYWRHRLSHKIAWYWPFHEFHHSANRLSILTAYRGHFVEVSVINLTYIVPFILLGVPVEVHLIILGVINFHQLLVHSAIKGKWGWVGEYLIVSPSAHRAHHSRKERIQNKNYGVTLIIWDRLFNTYTSTINNESVGLENNLFNKKGYINDVILPYKQFAKIILNVFKK